MSDEVQDDGAESGEEQQHAEPHEQEVTPGPSAPEPPNAPEEHPQTSVPVEPSEPAAEPAPEPAPSE